LYWNAKVCAESLDSRWVKQQSSGVLEVDQSFIGRLLSH
jgi:hypothetical protein